MNSDAMQVSEAAPRYVAQADARDVPPGYKQTEVGGIPEEWSATRLEKLAQIKTGSRNNQDKSDDGEYPFFVRSESVERIDTFSHDCEAILVPGEGRIGEIFHYIRGRFDVHQRVYAITGFRSDCDATYLHQYMAQFFGPWALQHTVKATVDSLRLPTFQAFHVALPKVHEQRAIAEALSDVDGLLRCLEALIAKKRAIKQAAMQQLLTGKTRLPGFSGEWETKRLGEIGHFLKGSGVKREDAQSGHLACVRYGEIYTTHHDYIREFSSWISPEVAATATRLEYGDLLFAGSGETKEEIGKCVALVVEAEAYAGGDIVILRPRNVDSLFLGYALNMPEIAQQKASYGQGDAVVHISAAALAQVSLSVPPRPEQTAIATVLSDMDAEIAALEARRDKTRAVKQGMMQQLLTGRVRLVKPEAAA